MTVSNIVLAVLVVLAIVGVATGAICEFMARHKQRHGTENELDRDMRNLFGLSRHHR